jgi:hypothetical protein
MFNTVVCIFIRVASEISRNVSRNFFRISRKFLNDFREISRNEIYENFSKFRESDLTKLYRNKCCLLVTA